MPKAIDWRNMDWGRRGRLSPERWLDFESAEVVMGWMVVDFHAHRGTPIWYIAEKEEYSHVDWAPTESRLHAWEIMDRLKFLSRKHDAPLWTNFAISISYGNFIEDLWNLSPIRITKAAIAAMGMKR